MIYARFSVKFAHICAAGTDGTRQTLQFPPSTSLDCFVYQRLLVWLRDACACDVSHFTAGRCTSLIYWLMLFATNRLVKPTWFEHCAHSTLLFCYRWLHMRFDRSRLYKIIDFSRIRKPIYDFLLVINCGWALSCNVSEIQCREESW